MGKILQFKQRETEPVKKVIGHRISFYTDEEIEVTILALNMYGKGDYRHSLDTLKMEDPLEVRSCLLKLQSSDMISYAGKRHIMQIFHNMEDITEAKEQ